MPPGEKGKAARWRLRGNLRTRALENSTSRTRKFREAILLLFPKRFSSTGVRVPKAEILHDGISDRCTLRKDRVLFPEKASSASPETLSLLQKYDIVLRYANLRLYS